MKKFLFLLLNACITFSAAAQEAGFAKLVSAEREISSAFTRVYSMQPGPERDSLNRYIIDSFQNSLNSWDGFHYDWEELDKIGRLQSDDDRLKIYTWHIEKNPGDFHYFGFIQYMEGKKKDQQLRLIALDDQSASISSPEMMELSPDNWYGALYYEIETFSYKRNTYYALFGYDFNDPYSRKKLIEVLTFRDDQPVFGAEFVLKNKTQKRFILEYSSQLVVSLGYDEPLDMIVFDHLAPFQPIFSGTYRFYGPDGSFDGFRFEEGSFILVEDVDVRNH